MLHSLGPMDKASRAIHYIYPPTLFLCFLVMQGITVCTLENLKASKKIIRKRLLLWLQISVIATYIFYNFYAIGVVAEAVLLLARSLLEKGWYSPEDHVVYVLSAILVWGVIELSLLDSVNIVWYPYYGCWFISLVTEICLLAVPGYFQLPKSTFQQTKFGIEAFRIVLLISLPLAFWGFQRIDNEKGTGNDEESAGLLPGSGGRVSNGTNGGAYGAINPNDAEENTETREARARMLKKIEESGNWWIYAKSFAIFWPYVWPSKDKWLKFSMVLVGLCLLLERGLNVLVPHQLGVVTNALNQGNGAVPWLQVSLYVIYRWLDSGSGISALQRYLWMPIDQYSYRSITTAAYNHVMSLSHDFHTNKKTGELYTSVNQGRSVNGFIESVLFAVLPMLADLCVAFGYFFWVFNSYMALIVAVVSVVYLWVTTKLGSMRNQMRRDFNTASRKEASIMWETMSSWTTVSYFNRVPYEQGRYSGGMVPKTVSTYPRALEFPDLEAKLVCLCLCPAIQNYQRAERNWNIGLSVLNVAQSLIFTFGLLGASFLAVYMVTTGQKQVGSFVTLLSYWAQLSSPLSFFANFYRKIQQQMLDAERLLELFQTKPTVVDKQGARDLQLISGEIEFDNVKFSYDIRKSAINGITFKAPGGSTIALVGETGGGKTTCLKLLFRFFDVESGAIRIDGQDIRDVTVWSLRENMGVVPQDPELFNDTIINNIKYANFDATDEQVYAACRAASIHEKIQSFPDGYLSKVGERGVKLSGGELQRVAIARAILKDPKIILLDEATSMVDMETERQIQSAFKKLSVNRTMFVVAHRLSTIMNADLIIVIKDGGILEKGNHDQLIEQKGKYHQLWSKQMKNDGPKPGIDPRELTMVNDLSPKSREEELKKALQKTGARFYGSELNLLDERHDKKVGGNFPFASQSAPAVFLKSHRKAEIGPLVAVQANTHSAVKPANGHLNVSFAIGESSYLNKSQESQFCSQDYSRTISPTQSTLKNIDTTKQLEKGSLSSRPATPKLSSSLKPDAREFVPSESIANEYSSAPQRIQIGFDPVDSSSPRVQVGETVSFTAPTSENVDQTVGKDTPPQKGQERQENDGIDKLQKEIDRVLKISEERVIELEGKKVEGIITKTQKPRPNDGARSETTQDEQPPSPTETQPEAELRKRRRRGRRRSNKSKSSIEENDGGVIVTEFSEATPVFSIPPDSGSKPPMANISPRPINDARLSNVGGEGSNAAASGIDKKPKRRFRSKPGGKPQNPGIEPGNQEPVPHRASTPSTETSLRQFKGKTRASSFIEGDYRSASREDTRPTVRDGSQLSVPPRQPELPTSTTPLLPKGPLREQGRRKTWGRYYGPKTNGNGNWRSRADNGGPSDGLASVYRNPSDDATGT